MANNKTLTARVHINTRQAEQAIQRLNRKLKNINKALDGTKANNLTKSLNKSDAQASRLRGTLSKVNVELNKSNSNTKKWEAAQRQVSKEAKNTNMQYKMGGSLLNSMGSKLKMLAATYLGVMGMRATVETTDTMIGAQNKLNYANSKVLGDDISDGYASGTLNATKDAMDKMYTSSQKVRMSYTDMMSNVSKFMALAPDAFQNSTDNAIRFQEIMSEAYAVGGASAAEMSSSMYQLTQALGAGTLAGDELRSVREGAPLAYKKIEEFAQGVYDTTESLKDLASQGKITSDMVVAAIMTAGDEMDAAFAQTSQTFAQTWDQIKNAAKKAFEPLANMLKDALQRAIESGLIQKIETFFTNVSKALQIVFRVIEISVQWIAEHWEKIKTIVGGVLRLVAIELLAFAAVSTAVAAWVAWQWIVANQWILWVAYAIYALVEPIYQFLSGVKTLSEALENHLLLVGIGLLILAVMLGNWWVALAGAIVLTLWAIWKWFDVVCGALWWLGALFKNIGLEIANFFIALGWVIANAFMTAVEFIVGLFNGCCSWIGALFSNLWHGAASGFWNFIASCVEGLDWLAKPLAKIAELFGKSFSYESFSADIRGKANAHDSQIKNLGDAWNEGYNKWSAPKWDENSSWSEKINTFDTWENGWGSEAYNKGKATGDGVKEGLNNWGSNLREKWGVDEFLEGNTLDKLGEKLGLDFGDSIFPEANGVEGAYKFPTIEELLGGISEDTGDIKDSMDLSNDDLEYLRKIAEMEWRNEFTTAEIKVDMTNHNTVNGERDLDGIVTYLSDVLREEMSNVAYGVHY